MQTLSAAPDRLAIGAPQVFRNLAMFPLAGGALVVGNRVVHLSAFQMQKDVARAPRNGPAGSYRW
jgi:hypothetical protein